MVVDTRITHTPSADVASARRLLDHVAHAVRGPSQVWTTPMLGRNTTVYRLYQDFFVRSIVYRLDRRFPFDHYPFYLGPLPYFAAPRPRPPCARHRALRYHPVNFFFFPDTDCSSSSSPRDRNRLHPFSLLCLRVAYLYRTRAYNPPRLASAKQENTAQLSPSLSVRVPFASSFFLRSSRFPFRAFSLFRKHGPCPPIFSLATESSFNERCRSNINQHASNTSCRLFKTWRQFYVEFMWGRLRPPSRMLCYVTIVLPRTKI